MKHNFEERRQNRINYAREQAAKKTKQSDLMLQHAQEMASYIPPGQPILVGHHSEKRDRNFRQKIDNKMHQSIDAGRKADYYADKANSIEQNNGIFSDDPDAICKLQRKLAAMEAAQAYMKTANKYIKKGDKVGFLSLPHSNEERWIALSTPGTGRRIGFPPYVFQNNSAKMRRIRVRIKDLEALRERKTTEEVINGVRILQNVEANRVQIFFDNIPEEAVRTKLKKCGFRWSPSEGAWQRHLNGNAVWTAQEILKKL